MQLTIERAQALAAIDRVGKLVAKKTTIPILAYAKIEVHGNRLTLTGTDLDIVGHAAVPADAESNGAATVSAHIFADIVRKLPEGAQLSLKASDDGSRIEIKSGRARFNLGALPPEDYPDIPEGDMSHRFALPAADLADLFGKVAFAISTEETRYYLNGVFLHSAPATETTGAKLIAVATDGHRLAKLAVDLPDGAADMPAIIVPRKAAAEMLRLAKDHPGAVEIACSSTKIRFQCGETIIVSKLIEGTFPDYTRVIPTEHQKRAELDRVAFLAAAERVAAVGGERGKGVKLTFAPTHLSLSVNNQDFGAAEDEVDASYSCDALEIGFNGNYLREILGTIDGETCIIRLGDAGSPALLAASDDAPLLIVLMPMRV